MTYDALLEEIFSRFPSVQSGGFTPGTYKPGLESMRLFDEALGSPSRDFRAVHVAGTNGKGSVCHMLASAFTSCGLRTGLYTSPHLLDFRERARIDGQLIPKEYVQAFLEEWLPFAKDHNLSFFEITTGLAFKWFADNKVDVAVIETGLGGRLDSTNILQAPEITVITSIGLDHMAQLGNTREEIAAEKAGIFKPGVSALIGERDDETSPVFEQKAYMLCPLHYAENTKSALWMRRRPIIEEMDLKAPIQEVNLRTVLAAIEILRESRAFKALEDKSAIVDGIIHAARNTGLRGRWELLSENPFVIADIGHNAAALSHNFRQLERYVESGEFSSLIIVYGIMADKDLDAILPLMPENATYIFAAPDTPRALPAGDLLRRFNDYRRSAGLPFRSFFSGSVRQAVQMATQLGRSVSEQTSRSASAQAVAPPLIYVGGSAYVVSEALPLFH